MATFMYRQGLNLIGADTVNPNSTALDFAVDAAAGNIMHLLVQPTTTAMRTATANGGPLTPIIDGNPVNSGAKAPEDYLTMVDFSTGGGSLAQLTSSTTGYTADGIPLSTSPSWAASTSGKGFRFQGGGGAGSPTGSQSIWNLTIAGTPQYIEGSVIYIWDGSTFNTGVPLVAYNYARVTPPGVSAPVTFNHPSDGLIIYDSVT